MIGKVVVNSLFGTEEIVFNYMRPVKCVQLDPQYSKKTSRRVVSGGMAGKLIVSEKGSL